MTPFKHPLCNDILRRPPGTTEEECGDLHIVRENGQVMSFWKPDAQELAGLNEGGAIGLIVQGATHPPVSVVACHPTDEDRKPSITSRFDTLLSITKRAIALWTKNHLEDPDRRAITDELLDFLSGVPKQVEKPSVDTDKEIERHRSDAESWRDEFLRVEGILKGIATALGDDWNTMPFDEAITALKNRLATAEAGRDTERERRISAETDIANLMHYAEGREGHVSITSPAIPIRDALIQLHRDIAEGERCLAIKRENLIEPLKDAIEAVITKAITPNPAEG